MTLTNQMRLIAIAADSINLFVDLASVFGLNAFNLECHINE